MTEAIKQWIDNQSRAEAIYEPKYGGKDHSGYDTMMKYEVNVERMEAFDNGLTKGIEIAEGFAEWITWRGIQQSTIPKCYTYQGDTLTTSELLEKYLIYLKTLEP